jgi:hypothetical protein
MKIETIVNTEVSILIIPENEMEEEIIKILCNQQNDIVQVRSTIVVLNKSYSNGLLIGKKTIGVLDKRLSIPQIDTNEH